MRSQIRYDTQGSFRIALQQVISTAIHPEKASGEHCKRGFGTRYRSAQEVQIGGDPLAGSEIDSEDKCGSLRVRAANCSQGMAYASRKLATPAGSCWAPDSSLEICDARRAGYSSADARRV